MILACDKADKLEVCLIMGGKLMSIIQIYHNHNYVSLASAR